VLPAQVLTPPPPAAVVETPPSPEQQSTQRTGRGERPPAPKAKVKAAQARKTDRTAGEALPRLRRAVASSQDETLLLAGGLALFVLVLADVILLTTLSNGALRRARSG
jgi:hypothetical protein